MDYLAPLSNNLGYCLAVEKLLGLEVPKRAQYIRVLLTELTRIGSHLVWLGTHAMDLGAMSVFLYCFREREEIAEDFRDGLRPADDDQLFPHRRPGAGAAAGLAGSRATDSCRCFPSRIDEYEDLLTNNRIWLVRTQGVGVISSARTRSPWAFPGPRCARPAWTTTCASIFPYSSYEEFDFDVPTRTEGDCYARYLCAWRKCARA